LANITSWKGVCFMDNYIVRWVNKINLHRLGLFRKIICFKFRSNCSIIRILVLRAKSIYWTTFPAHWHSPPGTHLGRQGA
jgi:hypothetical protein